MIEKKISGQNLEDNKEKLKPKPKYIRVSSFLIQSQAVSQGGPGGDMFVCLFVWSRAESGANHPCRQAACGVVQVRGGRGYFVVKVLRDHKTDSITFLSNEKNMVTVVNSVKIDSTI